MQEVVLVIHLILAVSIIGLVLLQRSSGGGLGTGGAGLGDFATARGAASAISRATMIFAFLFFGTSITLAIIAGKNVNNNGLLADYSNAPANAEAPVMPAAPNSDSSTPAPEAPVAPATPEPPITTQ